MAKLDLEKIKELHDKAFTASDMTRERSSDELIFYYITHWDDSVLDSQLGYKGEFDLLKKAARKILADLANNPIQVDFEPVDQDRTDGAELLDGVYRTDDNDNSTIEAYEVAKTEAVICGMGAWELHTEYSSMRSANDKQEIKREVIPEANNTVFFDPDDKSLDKSKSKYVSRIFSYTDEGYKQLVKDLTGEEIETVNESGFKNPAQAYTFPWISDNGKKIYIGKFYYKEKVKTKILTLMNPFGQEASMRKEELKDVIDELLDAGFTITDEKEIELYEVTQYVVSGERILSETIINGEHLPIVPIYGEHAVIQGMEHWEGIVRLAKDPQRLRDFILSYVADIASRSPRPKAIFFREQIAGFEYMYEESGAESNYPYYLQNRVDANGQPLPIGPVATMPEQTIPQALGMLIDATRQSVEDVANPGVPQAIADVDLSGKAVMALQAQIDLQSYIYQHHFKHAKRRDAEVYASMASHIMDVPRKIQVTLPDGTRKTVQTMQQVIDRQTGNIVVLNDIRDQEFKVYSKIGPDYKTQKDQTISVLTDLMANMLPQDPIRNILQLKVLMLMDGTDFDDVRDYVKKQLIAQGIRKPETPEEMQFFIASQQQGQQPSADMVLAQAEMLKGQASLAKVQQDGAKIGLEYQDKMAKNQISTFDAATKRLNVQVNAQKAGADVKSKDVETFGKQLDNTQKLIDLNEFRQMTDEQLTRLAMQPTG